MSRPLRRPLSDVTNVSAVQNDWNSDADVFTHDGGTGHRSGTAVVGAKGESGRITDLSAKTESASLVSLPLDRILADRATAQRYVVALRECLLSYQNVNAQLSRANADIVVRERQTQKQIKVATFRADRLSALVKAANEAPSPLLLSELQTLRTQLAIARSDLRRADDDRAVDVSTAAALSTSELSAATARIDVLETALAASQLRLSEMAAAVASSADEVRIREAQAESAQQSTCQLADAYLAAQESAEALNGIVTRLRAQIGEETAAVGERLLYGIVAVVIHQTTSARVRR